MYKSVMRDFRELAYNSGYVTLQRVNRHAPRKDTFVPYMADYMSYKWAQGDVKIATCFKSSYGPSTVEWEDIEPTEELNANPKAVKMMFLDFLIERLLVIASVNHNRTILVDSRDHDVAEILFERGFALRRDRGKFKGRRNVPSHKEKQ